MLGTADGVAPHLSPVDALVQWLVDEANHNHVVTPDNVQTQGDLLARLIILCRADHPLNGALEDLEGC